MDQVIDSWKWILVHNAHEVQRLVYTVIRTGPQLLGMIKSGDNHCDDESSMRPALTYESSIRSTFFGMTGLVRRSRERTGGLQILKWTLKISTLVSQVRCEHGKWIFISNARIT